MQEKIQEMLGAGLTQSQVAHAVGVDESYISQLMTDEEFVRTVQELRSEKASAFIEHDGRIDTMEQAALARISESIPFMKPMDALKTFQTLNSAKRKTGLNHGVQQVPSQIAILNLPENASVVFQLSTDNQVVSVEGRSVATLPSSNVTAMLRKRQAEAQLVKLTNGAAAGAPATLNALPSSIQQANRARRVPIEEQI